jgi:hypothetical protein
MPVGIGLSVQRLGRADDRVLAVAGLVAARSEQGWLAPGQLADMFEALRVPAPGISQALARLRRKGLMLTNRDALWSLTPEGRESWRDVMAEVDVLGLEAELAVAGAAELSQAQHPLIPAELAPVRWAVPIRRLLERHPFESNVFLMTRFPNAEREAAFPDPVRSVIDCARRVLAKHGLHVHLASDRNADDELFGNVAAHMWACKYGIALFETRSGDKGFNDNLQIEVGAMLMTGRRCALLRDLETPEFPTDFVGQIYKKVDFADTAAVAAVLDAWAGDDLGFAPAHPPSPSRPR